MSVFVLVFDVCVSTCLFVLLLSLSYNVSVCLGPCVMCCLKFASFLNNVCTSLLCCCVFCLLRV